MKLRVNLISDALPFGWLWYGEPDAVANAIGYADGVELTPQMALRVQGDVLGTIALARAGAGLAQTYQFVVARELARGELVEVLAHERGASRSFSLLYPRGVVQTPAVKKLVAFLVAEARRADVR